MPPNQNRRAERAKRAKDTVNKAIPDILRASPRARHGIHKADLIVDPSANSSHPTTVGPALAGDGPRIRVQCTDTLAAASRISERPFAVQRTAQTPRTKPQSPNVTILNMASPLRPGGGFLDGANSQEEFLCTRSTLYPSLWDSFYRLPDIGGVYTPDVMVFRDSTPEANELAKRDRFFVDVITSAMLRFPETNRGRVEDLRAEGCSCGVSYCDRDRELVTRKMKAVLRMAESRGARQLVLGAWGCGAYGNPVREVAKIWRKVIAGGPRQRRPNAERWTGLTDIVFAIPDRAMLREFERAFEDILSHDPISPPSGPDAPADGSESSAAPARDPSAEDAETAELISKIAETEMQMEQTRSARQRAQFRETLGRLNRELTQGLAARRFEHDDPTLAEDEEEVEVDEEGEEGYVVFGVPASDGEENSFYHFDENDVPTDSSDGADEAERYEFRTPRPPAAALPPAMHFDSSSQDDSHTSPDDDDDDDDDSDDDDVAFRGSLYPLLAPSPAFDAQTGWYTGSIDQFHSFMRGGGGGGLGLRGKRGSHVASPPSPVLRPDSSGLGFDEERLRGYLDKYADGER